MQSKELLALGEAYEKSGNLDMARRSYARVIALYPQEEDAYAHLTRLALNDGDHSQALALVEKGLATNERSPTLWNSRGLVLIEKGEMDSARESFQSALSLQPNDHETLTNLGTLLIQFGMFEEAEQHLRRALDAQQKPLPLTALASCLYRQHRFDEAEQTVSNAISLDPSNAKAHFLRSLLHFSTGDLLMAWEEYEWRFHLPNWKARRTFARKPQWLGEPLHHAALLVHAEQGLGDSLQFVRFIPEIAKLDCEIVVDIQPELYKLCSSSFEFANLRWSRSEKLPSSDLQIPMLSVPGALGVTYDNLPPAKPYIFAREREVQAWRGKLNKMTGIAWGREVERRKQLRVGLVWAGSASNPDDRNRSMTFDDIRPIIEAHKERAIFFSLQKDQRVNHPDVIDLGEELTDFAVTAAIIENLDLIISVDTSTLHLAGAMGKRVWSMLSHTPDWRWVIGQEETKWYPTMSLFCQKQPGKWGSVVSEISKLLAA